jgi:GNAT superfamily N-acetyltransferase
VNEHDVAAGGDKESHPLDNAAWAALTSHHGSMAEVHGQARRYARDVSPFTAIDRVDESSWLDLAGLAGAGHPVALFRGAIPFVPPNWTELARGRGHQLTLDPDELTDVEPTTVRRLTVDDVPRMLALVALTTPGPFLPRTIEMGRYYGHFDGDELVAMAGERLHLEGYTEISAVCTHPDARGRGLASALTHTVAAGILERGEQPFLHVAQGNDSALRVYERLGFTRRRQIEFVLVAPG